MSGEVITGIFQCILAIAAIAVDIWLVFLANQLSKRQEQAVAEKAIEKNNARTTIDMTENGLNQRVETKIPTDVSGNGVAKNNKKKKRIGKIIERLIKKYEHAIPAVSFVIAMKDLFSGDESFVVKLLQFAKNEGYLLWDGNNLRTGTIISIEEGKESELIDYFGSCKP